MSTFKLLIRKRDQIVTEEVREFDDSDPKLGDWVWEKATAIAPHQSWHEMPTRDDSMIYVSPEASLVITRFIGGIQ